MPMGQWTYGFVANGCVTIDGGTSVIDERLLGLPRDLDPGE